ncbi:MAG: NAD-dependent epimerase/dehydratase family protein [Candidatus Heimdallarchaeaceae archaeon]
MKVLLTGAFGNVGQNTLIELLKKGHSVRCFDLKTPRNVKLEKKIKKIAHKNNWTGFEVVWGDIRSRETVSKLAHGVDCIIHLAAIIPPLAYEQPKLAYDVNVKGTTMLIEEAENQENKPKFIYASSIAVHGNRMKYDPPTKIDDPLAPLDYDNYAKHKMIMEKRLRESNLEWVILRFGVVTPFEISFKIPEIMFEIPLDQRMELADTRDVGLACANAVSSEEAIGKTLFIGGGEGNQLYQRDYIKQMLNSMGIGMLPETAFKPIESVDDFYHCDWMDTKEAQEILQFQRLKFDDFIKEFKRRRWFMRVIVSIFRPIARAVLLAKSPYYEKPRAKKQRTRAKRDTVVTGN